MLNLKCLRQMQVVFVSPREIKGGCALVHYNKHLHLNIAFVNMAVPSEVTSAIKRDALPALAIPVQN